MRKAFTLIELLVVVAIIAILAAVLLPAVLTAVEHGKSVQCLANVRQCSIAAQGYTVDHDGTYPVAYEYALAGPTRTTFGWDFTTVTEGSRVSVLPGILWNDGTDMRIQQCPSFDGEDNWANEPFTGYNYNTSYVGRPDSPATVSEIGSPEQCALFGDGEYAGGANKFMRSPFPSPSREDAGFSGRYAGTQGFRHRGRTNVAFCDGHAESLGERYTHYAGPAGRIADKTGFLSADNRLYDLE